MPTDDNQKRLAGASVLNLDVRHAADVASAIKTIEQSAGKLDVLVNNAGIISDIGPIESLDSAALSAAFDVNVAGLHRMTVAALPLLKASKGTIVNAGTGAATTPMEGWTPYCCSKAGARMLTGMFELELAGSGIQNFFIGIPPTDTDIQTRIRTSGLNPVSQIAQTEIYLDVRDPLFKDMMGTS